MIDYVFTNEQINTFKDLESKTGYAAEEIIPLFIKRSVERLEQITIGRDQGEVSVYLEIELGLKKQKKGKIISLDRKRIYMK